MNPKVLCLNEWHQKHRLWIWWRKKYTAVPMNAGHVLSNETL